MQTVKRLYSFSDAELYVMAGFILNTAKGDLNQLADQGVTQEKLDAIEEIRGKFIKHDSDSQLMYDLKEATKLRDEAGKLMLQYINQVASKALFKFGETDARYLTYAVGSISHDAPMAKYVKACRVLKVGKEQQPELLADGLTDALLLKLKEQAQLFFDLILAQGDAKQKRKDMMRERTELGNELYTAIKILAGQGKLYWMYVNSAKHDAYVLYHRQSPGSQTIESKIEAESSVSHDLAGVKPATEIKITNKGLTELTVFFAKDPLDINGEPFSKILPGAEKKIPASGIGYDKAKGKTCFNVVNGGAVEGVYEVRWK